MTNAHNNNTKNGSTNGTRRGKRRGFTLIEILIVVVILGVLAALVIPGVTSALGDSNKKAALARAAQITTMVTRAKQFGTSEQKSAMNALSGTSVTPDQLAALAPSYFPTAQDLWVPGDTDGSMAWNFDVDSGSFSSPYPVD